jgi:hypothetical protein
MGIEGIHHLYDEFQSVPETKVTSMTAKKTAKTPEPPNEPDVFDENKLEADEAEADFDAEETNKKESSE